MQTPYRLCLGLHQTLRWLWQTWEQQRYSFISKYPHFNTFPSAAAPKSLHLADPCLPPVIQCSVMDRVQELVHIIPQHAPSNLTSRARLLLPWGQRSNRGTEPQQRASSGDWIFQNERMKLSCSDMSVCFSHIAGFIWMYFWSGPDRPKDVLCSLNSLCLNQQFIQSLFQTNPLANALFLKKTTILWKWSYHHDKPSRLKRRWVTILHFLSPPTRLL